tara:strand:- start:518 stop:916 length:399 start_codon:yes stop_codon:yes gene_type:complete
MAKSRFQLKLEELTKRNKVIHNDWSQENFQETKDKPLHRHQKQVIKIVDDLNLDCQVSYDYDYQQWELIFDSLDAGHYTIENFDTMVMLNQQGLICTGNALDVDYDDGEGNTKYMDIYYLKDIGQTFNDTEL